MPVKCDNCKTTYVSNDIKVETCTKCGKKITKPVKMSKALKNFLGHRRATTCGKKITKPLKMSKEFSNFLGHRRPTIGTKNELR